jgi:methyl-accepting chemotaxis protein
MDANISEANKRLAATCEQTLQQLDDIETKLAVLFEEIETHASLFSARRSSDLAHAALQVGQSNALEVDSVVIPRQMNHCDDSH